MTVLQTRRKESAREIGTRTYRVAIAGNPNTGKTTVFNALTGLRQKVANYPGVTVEKKTGMLISPAADIVEVIDLPGLYSLIPKSLDDQITIDTLLSIRGEKPLDMVVVVADATNLSRNLFLVSQIAELGFPSVLALNMSDNAVKIGLTIDSDALSAELNMPVIPVVANKRKGISQLRKAIFSGLRPQPLTAHPRESLIFSDDIDEIVSPVIPVFHDHFGENQAAARAQAIRVISSEEALLHWAGQANGTMQLAPETLEARIRQVRENLTQAGLTWQTIEIDARYAWIDALYKRVVSREKVMPPDFSERLDRVLTHRIGGPIIFVAIFAFVFQSIFSWAELPMAMIEESVSWFGEIVATIIPEGVIQSLLVEGVIGGVGAVLVFLPQILFLFFFLSLLEDSGYLARVAFMVDRVMVKLGLSGRSVIPLLSSFACAIPGIMATRTIQNWRERLISIMIAPFMSCSARLPVYTLMIGAFVSGGAIFGIFSYSAITLLAMYLLGIVAAIGAALVFKKFLMTGQAPTSFVMELPPYRLPSLRWTFMQMLERASIFIKDAGKIILAISVILWFLASYPRNEGIIDGGARIQQSYAGQLGKMIEPVIEPLGFDWKMGIGIITSFAAREVLVSTLATIYSVEGSDETSTTLREALRNDRDPETGEPVYSTLVAISLMVFYVLACQCMATLAVVKRETNSWRWPVIMLVYMTVLAYLASLVVYQGGLWLGFG